MLRLPGEESLAAVPVPVLQQLVRHAHGETTLAFDTDVDDVLEEAILKA